MTRRAANEDRDRLIVRMCKGNESYVVIAKKYGISHQRVAQIAVSHGVLRGVRHPPRKRYPLARRGK